MKKNPKASKPRKKARPGIRPWLVTVAALLLAAAVGYLAWLQLGSYEQGVLDVYATQQDGYVQLVLEQIRLTEQRGGSEADIERILATLDASSTRYWTLSRQSSLIFVKDVTETNRYQAGAARGGFTTASYYQTDSAKGFVDALSGDRIVHDTIQIGSQSYVASGAEFRFQGNSYKVCLLTNIYTILDHNAYLTAKINLITLALIALVIFVVAIEILFFVAGSYRRKYFAEAEDNVALRKQTEKLNSALHKEDLYDAQRTAYTAKALPMLWEKLEGKDAWPLTLLILRCGGEEEQHQFLRFTQFQMNHKILRALLDDEHILLVLLRVEALELSAVKENIQIPGVQLTGELTLTQPPEDPLETCFNRFVERTLEDEKQTAL